MCGPAAIVVGGAMLASQMYASSKAKKAARRRAAREKLRAEREQAGIESAVGQVDQLFDDPLMRVRANEPAQETARQGIAVADEQHFLDRQRQDINLAARGLIRSPSRDQGLRRLKQNLALGRAQGRAAGALHATNINQRLEQARQSFTNAIISGQAAPSQADTLRAHRQAIGEAAQQLPMRGMASLVNAGTYAVQTDTNARAAGNRGLRVGV